MIKYPHVIDEMSTMNKILEGYSIARAGDGEKKLASGTDCVSQRFDLKLQHELKSIFQNNNQKCLVGIPTLNPISPKFEYWTKFYSNEKYRKLLDPNKTYYSAFITRPDSAPWIDCDEFHQKVIDLWRNKKVTLVTGSNKAFTPEMLLKHAKSVQSVRGTKQHSYSLIDQLEMQIIQSNPDVVIMNLGATATCLANRLSIKDIQAIDLGHQARLMRKILT